MLADDPLCYKDAAQMRQLGIRAYRETIAGCAAYPSDEKNAHALLELAILEKLFYEIGYELANRPAWVTIPIVGALSILQNEK